MKNIFVILSGLVRKYDYILFLSSILILQSAECNAGLSEAGGLVSYPVPVISDNLLTNPGFEEINPANGKPTGWTFTSAFSVDATSHSGSYSAMVKDAPSYAYADSAYKTVTLTKGNYRIGGWIKTDLTDVSPKGVRISLVGGSQIATVVGITDWEYYSATNIAIPADGNYTYKLELYTEPAGTARFDDLELRKEFYPVQAFMLYPNYRGLLYEDKSQTIKLDISVDPYPGKTYADYVVQNIIEVESTHVQLSTSTTNASANFKVTFEGTGLQSDTPYLLRTLLLNKSDNSVVYEYPAYRIIKVSATTRSTMKAWFDEDQRYIIDGKPTFILGVYDSGGGYNIGADWWINRLANGTVTSNYADSRRLFELPINFYLNYWLGQTSSSVVNSITSALYSKKINYISTNNQFGSYPYTFDYFSIDTDPTFLPGIASNPGLLGFYMSDESLTYMAPTLFKVYDKIRTGKPDGLVFGAEMYPNAIPAWRDITDLIAMDPYPKQRAAPWLFNQVADWTLATRVGTKFSRPVSTVIQFWLGTGTTEFPTYDEIRNMSYMAIAEGSNGLIYWSIGNGLGALATTCNSSLLWTGCPERVNRFENLKSVMNEIKSLEPALTAVDSPTLLLSNSNPTAIHTRVKFADGKGYLIASNNTHSTVSATFTWSGTPLKVDVFNESRQLTVAGSSFTDTFTPFQAHVYEITTVKSTDTTRPIVRIVSPVDGGAITNVPTIKVEASDNVSVSRVELYMNDKLFSVATSLPYDFTWGITTYPKAIYDFYAKAYDTSGTVASSDHIYINTTDLSVKATTRIPEAPKNPRVVK